MGKKIGIKEELKKKFENDGLWFDVKIYSNMHASIYFRWKYREEIEAGMIGTKRLWPWMGLVHKWKSSSNWIYPKTDTRIEISSYIFDDIKTKILEEVGDEMLPYERRELEDLDVIGAIDRVKKMMEFMSDLGKEALKIRKG